MEHALLFSDRRRRGRKRKAEKMAELAMAEALAKRQHAKSATGFDQGMFLRSCLGKVMFIC